LLYSLLQCILSLFINGFAIKLEAEASFELLVQESLAATYHDPISGKEKTIHTTPDFMMQLIMMLDTVLQYIIEVKPLRLKPVQPGDVTSQDDAVSDSQLGDAGSGDNTSPSTLSSVFQDTANDITSQSAASSIATGSTSNHTLTDRSGGDDEELSSQSEFDPNEPLMAQWHGPDAIIQVVVVLKDSLAQLMTQALFAFKQYEDKQVVRIIFDCGFYVVMLSFPRPPSLDFSHTDLLDNGKIPPKTLVKLFPYVVEVDGVANGETFRPHFIIPLTTMFTFDDDGRITGFEEEFMEIFRINIVELAPKAERLTLQPLFESLASKTSEKDDEKERKRVEILDEFVSTFLNTFQTL
jgi:hypothetical protein